MGFFRDAVSEAGRAGAITGSIDFGASYVIIHGLTEPKRSLTDG